MPKPMPRRDTAATPSASESPAKQLHWLAVIALLIAGLTVAGLVSYLGSATLTM